MSKKQKYLVYGLGFFIGCIIFTVVLTQKQNHKASQDSHTKPPYRTVSLKELQESPTPMDPVLALFHVENSDDKHDDPRIINRTLIFENSGPSGYIRVVETINQKTSPEQLLKREVMSANQILISLKAHTSLSALTPTLHPIGAKIVQHSSNPTWYLIEFRSHAPHTVPKYLQQLKELDAIREVKPVYYNI